MDAHKRLCSDSQSEGSLSDGSSSSYSDYSVDESSEASFEQAETSENVTAPSTRQERRSKRKQSFLKGKGRKVYRFSSDLQHSFEDSELSNNPAMSSHFQSSSWNKNVCQSCAPVLQKYAVTFKGLKRQGSELKRRKWINPHPKQPETQQYRDLVKQNDWLRSNIFDTLGNYIFCCGCVHHALGISFQRLARQRAIKRRLHSEPLRSMTKSQVEVERLGEYVVMPEGCSMSFVAWWKSQSQSDMVEVRYPHDRHGLAGRASHAAKVDTKRDFLDFIDANSQPNGRSADSSSATHFLLPKFRTIQTPKAGVTNYEQRFQQSIVGVFNQVQGERQRDTISNYSASTWLKAERPKYSIYPHKLDYCDFCAKKKELIQAKQTTLNRIRQTGSAGERQQLDLEAKISMLNDDLKTHREHARKSHEYYIETTTRCKKEWVEIQALESKENRNQQENEALLRLQHNFTATLSIDYQMQKLVPYWGQSPQPGSTYYLQKLLHDIFGVVDHREGHSTIYIFDETVGPKNTDHTMSLMTHFINDSGTLPPWTRRIHIFLDNTGSTNKNAFLMAWGMELVQHKVVDYLRFSFLIAGHTKFDVDRLFSVTSKAYNSSDVFNTRELTEVMSQSDSITAIIDNGTLIHNWRDKVSEKYSKLPGIRDLHDFFVIRNPTTGNAMMSIQDHCYEGVARPTTLKLNKGMDAGFDTFPTSNETYTHLGRIRTLTSTKLAHLRQMCTNFIPQDRWPDCMK
jgi:hypothetical protein